MLRCPLSLPLSKSYGARPTRAAICLRLMRPSSGSRAMSVKASTGSTPGHRGQARVTPREIGIGGDHLGEALVLRASNVCGHDGGEPREDDRAVLRWNRRLD